MGEWLLLAGTAVGATVVAFAAARLVLPADAPARAVPPPADGPDRLVLGDLTASLAAGLPGAGRDAEELQPLLRQAGFYRPSALLQYRAVRAAVVFGPLLVAAAAAAVAPTDRIAYIGFAGLLLAALGYALPRAGLTALAAARTREVERGLPVFADMLAIALMAGQPLGRAVWRVGEQLARPFPRLAAELGLVARQAELYDLGTAVGLWADRSRSTDVRTLGVILAQSQRLGTDVSAALAEYAAEVRGTARQRADARAQRAGFWMLFPTILCLWIPAAVVMVGPVLAEFSARRTRARDAAPRLGAETPAGKALTGDRGGR